MKIAVASGKGGTGKTFVAVNLFRTFNDLGYQTSLTDCDVEVPNAMAFFSTILANEQIVADYRPVIDVEKCLFCGRCAEYCEYHAILHVASSHYIRLLNDLCHGCGACSIACKSGAISDSSTMVGKISTYEYEGKVCLAEGRMKPGISSPVPLIKLAVGELFSDLFEYHLYDSPPGTSCPFVQTVAKADYVVLVTEPTPFGLSDLKQAVETLNTIGKPFGVIVNRAGLGDNQVYEYLKEKAIDLLLEIPFDEEVARLYSEGKIVVDEYALLNGLFKQLSIKLIEKWR
ncbi:ATP-binding protein [uncultured Bacteroides sp.]|uniref:ATP-binding protein n=1 Tax=uncultured Bacteroides sp. TaxID=162156 RepID=UPI002AAAB460|nr:ATP-binding protein [uncultured Bacteroides sp.]